MARLPSSLALHRNALKLCSGCLASYTPGSAITATASTSRIRSFSSLQACSSSILHRSSPLLQSPNLPSHSGIIRQNAQQRRSFWWSSGSSSLSAASASPFSGSGTGQAAWETLDFVPQISNELVPLLLALLLTANAGDDDTDESGKRPFTVQSVPEKGLGAFASQPISRGEIIIAERALLIWPTKLSLEEAQKLIANLTPSARKAFFSLANIADPSLNLDPIFGIRATNGFNVELPSMPSKLVSATLTAKPAPSTASFIFSRIARINHSCAPNADHAMDWSSLKMTVYATTAIEPAAEICIEYQAGLVQKTRDERREALKRDFGFDCHCSVCSQTGEALHNSDSRRREINAIVGALGEGKMANKNAMWQTLDRLEYLLDQEGYKAMPEFTHQRVSDAYVGFKTIKQQKQDNS